MAQLVERLVRNEKASGSNPLISTKNNQNRTRKGIGFGYFFFGGPTKMRSTTAPPV